MTRRQAQVSGDAGAHGHGITERNLAPRTGLRMHQVSIPLRNYQSCIGGLTMGAVDVTTYTDGPAYPSGISNAQARLSFNPDGIMPYPATVCVMAECQVNEAAGATGSGRNNAGIPAAGSRRTFQVKLFGLDPHGQPIMEELPEQTIDDPSHLFAQHCVWSSKVFARVTKWQYKYTNMRAPTAVSDKLNIGMIAHFNRNVPLYLFQDATGGSFNFTYKGQTVSVSMAADMISATALATKLNTLSNINAGDLLIDSPLGITGGTTLSPYRIWISDNGGGSGAPLLGVDAIDRTQVYVNSAGLTGGKSAVWLATPRYINQDNNGLWLPLISDVYGPDSPHPSAEYVAGAIEMVMLPRMNAVAITDPADSPATADALRDDLVANTIPSIELGFLLTPGEMVHLPASKVVGGVRTCGGLVFGLNASGAQAASEPQKVGLYLERFNRALELHTSNNTGSAGRHQFDQLYEDTTSQQERAVLHLTLRTTRGLGRDAINKSSYVYR